MATTSDLKNGTVIKFNGDLHSIMSVEHRTPGNLRAFYQVKMRNLKNGKTIEHRFRSGEEVQLERLEQKTYQFLYKDGENFNFMDNETYDQIHLLEELVGKQGEFMKEGQEVQIIFHNESPISLEIPAHVTLKVISAPPGVKGNTATNATKQITVETGAIVNAPMFIDEGEFIKVDTRTGDYIERVKV
ncbi:MAG TPA: elongation factor P [Bacteroidetes bacterium]|nr:elongation factor P [Ignavibacteria bacterium]HCA43924.1 elongation factor P [Bacteroidota bacterium]HCN36629.1 elongation factor P [Bacteroidota bacterium]